MGGGAEDRADLPTIYLHRGVSGLGRGDLAAASAELSTANAKAPHYTDPLKAWGDLLTQEGRWKDALAKYDEAFKYAPCLGRAAPDSRHGGAEGVAEGEGRNPPRSVLLSIRSAAAGLRAGRAS